MDILNDILESYINGQIEQAKSQLADSDHSVGDLFEYYIDIYNYKIDSDLKLFVRRMTGKY